MIRGVPDRTPMLHFVIASLYQKSPRSVDWWLLCGTVSVIHSNISFRPLKGGHLLHRRFLGSVGILRFLPASPQGEEEGCGFLEFLARLALWILCRPMCLYLAKCPCG